MSRLSGLCGDVDPHRMMPDELVNAGQENCIVTDDPVQSGLKRQWCDQPLIAVAA